ncbi:MAG: ArnT family glycosyltransferase [Armatimonadota bacterium]
MILTVHILLALTYWHYIPYGASPDEGPHGKYVQALSESHRLPVFKVTDRQGYEAHQPPLYYALGVPFYLLGQKVGMDEPAEMVRLLSVILGAVSILVVYYATASAFPQMEDLALGAAGFVALLPTHVILAASVSNDPLMELVFGIGLLVLARTLVRGLTLPRSIALGVVLGMALLTKSSCVLLFPIALTGYWLAIRHWRLGARQFFAHFTTAIGISILIGGWWLARNQLLYGDPLAVSQFESAFAHTPKPQFFLDRGCSMLSYVALVGMWTFASFWGVFGHMNVFMPTWLYTLLGVVSGAAMIASCRQLKQLAKSDVSRRILAIYGVAVVLTVAAFVEFNIHFFQAQGRYLYPAIIPLSLWWILGMQGLLPARLRRHALLIATGIPALVQIPALITCISRMPYY